MNLGEVFYLCAKARDLAYGERVLENLRVRVGAVSAGDDLVLHAARLKARHPISYADAFAAATAMLRDAPLVTGDPGLQAMAAAEPTLQVELDCGLNRPLPNPQHDCPTTLVRSCAKCGANRL